jgi:hypothetical protein
MDKLKDSRGYWKLKEEALDRTLCETRLGRGWGPVVRKTAEWTNKLSLCAWSFWTKFWNISCSISWLNSWLHLSEDMYCPSVRCDRSDSSVYHYKVTHHCKFTCFLQPLNNIRP